MFIEFFYLLRKRGVPVSVTEWISFTEALYKGFMESSLNHLYYVGQGLPREERGLLDMYDLAFQEYFGGVATNPDELDKFLEWLENPASKLQAQLRGNGRAQEAAEEMKAEVRHGRDDADVQGAPEGPERAP